MYKKMLHSNNLVKEETDNIYFEVSIAKLENFQMTERVVEELKTREVNGKVKFMAYNDNFIERFNMLKNKRHIVHIHIGLNTLLLLVLELYLYELI